MKNEPEMDIRVEVHPATRERWEDMETLFGPRGAYGGCWCMFWRLQHADFKAMKPDDKKAAMWDLTAGALPPGVLAYAGGKAVGWCAVGPRENFVGLEHSRTLKRLDDTPVWSIVCFFVARQYRRAGMMAELLRGALAFARQNGARVVEGYPIDMHTTLMEGQKLTGYSGFMGIADVFREAGFSEVAEASETQRVMRCVL